MGLFTHSSLCSIPSRVVWRWWRWAWALVAGGLFEGDDGRSCVLKKVTASTATAPTTIFYAQQVQVSVESCYRVLRGKARPREVQCCDCSRMAFRVWQDSGAGGREMGGIGRHNARPPGRNRGKQLTSRVFALSLSLPHGNQRATRAMQRQDSKKLMTAERLVLQVVRACST